MHAIGVVSLSMPRQGRQLLIGETCQPPLRVLILVHRQIGLERPSQFLVFQQRNHFHRDVISLLHIQDIIGRINQVKTERQERIQPVFLLGESSAFAGNADDAAVVTESTGLANSLFDFAQTLIDVVKFFVRHEDRSELSAVANRMWKPILLSGRVRFLSLRSRTEDAAVLKCDTAMQARNLTSRGSCVGVIRKRFDQKEGNTASLQTPTQLSQIAA
jgi:hypothetical protein